MKNLLFLLTVTLTLSCCNKNDDDQPPTNPIDQLPPATQTGAQTFGCLINGEVFVPPIFGNNAPSAFYQLLNGTYTLGISGRSNANGGIKSIIIGGIDIPSINETTYALESLNSGVFYSLYDFENEGDSVTYYTNEDLPGILTITNFDQINFIISGTFEFTILDNDGNEINITNGRFDMNYTN